MNGSPPGKQDKTHGAVRGAHETVEGNYDDDDDVVVVSSEWQPCRRVGEN